jgi:hypothetical protein
MSKTQEKRAQRLAESEAFVLEKRRYQLQYLEANFNVGVQMYEANKDKISEEEQTAIEAEMVKQREWLDTLKEKVGI